MQTIIKMLCKLLWEHQEKVVARYADHVAIWNVVSGVNVNRLVQLDNDQMIDLTRRSAVLVRQAQRNAKVLVELVHPFDDQVASCPDSVPGYEYAVRTLDEGVHVTVLASSSSAASRKRVRGSRPALTERCHRSIRSVGASAHDHGTARAIGGYRGRCGSLALLLVQERQARWATSMFGIAMGKMTNRGDTARSRSVGVVEGVLWSGLVDVGDGMPTGLLGPSCSPRKVMTQLAAVRHALRRPLQNSKVNASMFSLDPEGITG